MPQPSCDVRVRLLDAAGNPFMGIGVLWLLEGVSEHGSLRQAALEMELSYPKALRMIRSIEQQAGRPVVERHKGGRDHGGAELTDFGREFVQAYRQLVDCVQQCAQQEYTRRFGTLLTPAPPASEEQ